MKKYVQLSQAEKEQAVRSMLNLLLEAVVESRVVFIDEENEEEFQVRIDEAISRAREEKKPWLAGDYVMKEVGEELIGMARCQAEQYLYTDDLELVPCLHS